MKTKLITSILTLIILTCATYARELSITIYNNNFCLVKDIRNFSLKAGINEFEFVDIPTTIEPSSVRFRSLEGINAYILEQNYQFDLVNSKKLFKKYLGEDVEILTRRGDIIFGKLLRAEEDNIIVKTKTDLRIISFDTISAIKLGSSSKGLILKPTLLAQIWSEKDVTGKFELDYIASGMKWQATYNLKLSSDETHTDLVGWITIENKTGSSFPDTKVTLIAGEPLRPQGHYLTYGVDYLRAVHISKLKPQAKRGKEISESFGEYRLYHLPRKTTIKNNEVKQIKLIGANDIKIKKIYLYDGAKIRFSPYIRYLYPSFGRESNKKVNVLIEIENRADNNLGFALPEGIMRIFKEDKDQAVEFIGEDRLPSTPADEKILVYMGDAFDIVGQRTQTKFKRISRNTIEESFKIILKNHKGKSVKVRVIEKLYRWTNWEIISNSDKYEKLNARTIKFDVNVPSNGKKQITYTVRYTW